VCGSSQAEMSSCLSSLRGLPGALSIPGPVASSPCSWPRLPMASPLCVSTLSALFSHWAPVLLISRGGCHKVSSAVRLRQEDLVLQSWRVKQLGGWRQGQASSLCGYRGGSFLLLPLSDVADNPWSSWACRRVTCSLPLLSHAFL
jgi:hypothetical protein